MINKKLLFLLPLVLIAFVPQSAEAVTLENHKFKVVVNFKLDGNPNTIRGSYQQQVAPQLVDMFDDLGLNTFDKTGNGAKKNPHGYSAKVHVTSFAPVGTNPIKGDGIYQIYPLIKITGDRPDLTDAQLNADKDVVLALQRTAIVDWLQTEGAYDVSTYIHYSFGPVRVDEGF